MTELEKVNKGIESLEYRLASLAAKFANVHEDEALAVARKINAYGRAFEVLEEAKARLIGPQQTTTGSVYPSGGRVYPNTSW